MKPKKQKQPAERVRKGIQADHVLDIETEQWDQFVVGGIWHATDGSFVHFDWRQEKALVEYLLSLDGQIWAHNGGRYDFLWLCDWLHSMGIKAEVFATGARVTLIKIGKRLELRDSAALVPMSLADGSRIGKVRKSETGLLCGCGKACGGYCRIRRGMSHAELCRLVGYLRADCEATGSMLATLEEYSQAHDLDLRGTIGASAWATAQRWLSLPDAEWLRGAIYYLTRDGYYGGRVQVLRPESKRGWRYDINSSYPAALASLSLPIGAPLVVTGSDAQTAFLDDYPGIYHCTVRVPPMFVPPLPYRSGEGRVYYPTGNIAGAWPKIEIDYALSLGCEVLSHKQATVWRQSAPTLARFARDVWALRADCAPDGETEGKATPLGKWLKLFANSLTGKLAQRPESEQIVMAPESPRACPGEACRDFRRVGFCCGACGAYTTLGKTALVWERDTWRIPPNGHVQWAAYLTAYARIQLHRQMVACCAGECVVYCDTDSVYSEHERSWNIGPELGQWLPEGEFRDFVALAPKLYTFTDAKSRRKVRAKGIPDAAWETIMASIPLGCDIACQPGCGHDGAPIRIDRGVKQFRSAARGGKFFQRKDMSRQIRPDGSSFGDRKLKNGLTYPVDVKHIPIHERRKPGNPGIPDFYRE